MDKLDIILELDLAHKDWLNFLENCDNFRILKLLNCNQKEKTIELLSSQRFVTIFNQSQYLFVLQIFSNDLEPLSLAEVSSILHKIKAQRPVIVHWISTQSSKSHIFYKQPDEEVQNPTKEKTPINWIVANLFHDDGFIQKPCDFMLDSELELMEEAIQTGDVLAIRFLNSLSDNCSMGHEEVNVAATKGFECLKAVLKLPINASGVDEQCRKISFKLLNLASNPEPFFTAIKSQNLELVRFITEVNDDSTLHSFLTDAVDLCYQNMTQDILSYLIFEMDAPFPTNFDKDSVNDQLKEKTKMRDLFHEAIASDNAENVDSYITKYPNLRRAYSSTNSSALQTAIVSNRFHIFSLLKFNDYVLENDFIETLTDHQKHMIKDANIKSFTRIEDSHLQFLISKTRKSSGEAKKEFSKRCRHLYRKLDDIKHISLILKVIEHSESLDIILDFEEESVKAMDPTMSENTKGSCDYKQGRIYIGAKKREEAILGTIAHELTHLAMQILFDNDSNPYESKDSPRRIELEDIVRRLRFQSKPLDRIIEAVFASYKDSNVWHSEIIVRVPQILAEYGEELGTKTLTKQAEDLFEWYEERLVPQMKTFIEDPYKYKNKVKIRRLNSRFGLLEVIKTKAAAVELSEDRLIDCLEKVSVYIRSNTPKLTLVNILQGLLATYKTFNEVSSAVLFVEAEHFSIELITEAFMLNALQKFVLLHSDDSKINYEPINFLAKSSLDVMIVGEAGLESQELQKYMRLIEDERYLWKHLKYTSQNKLLGSTVTFQGVDVALNEMLRPITDNMHKQKLDISQLLERDLKIGRELEQATIIGTTLFIKRTFSRRETTSKRIRLDKDANFHVVDSEEEFKSICQTEKNSVHFLENSVWKKSRGDVSIVLNYLEKEKTFFNSEDFLLRASEEKVIIISNVAGMGKSVVIGHLAKEIKVRNPLHWVIQIPLHNYAQTISNSLDSQSEFENIVQAAVLQLDNFGRAIFAQKQSTKIYLFDGFDEIETKLQDKLIGVIQTLVNSNGNQVWITTRPHEKERLERAFDSLSYSIEPFTIEDQCNFLVEYWKEDNLDKNIERNLQSLAYSVLDRLSNTIDDKLLEVTGVPLQMTLLGDYTLEIARNSKEEIYYEPISIIKLYKSFIDRKIRLYFVEKLELKMSNHSISQQVANWTKAIILEHTFLAFAGDSMPLIANGELNIVDMAKYGIISVIAGNAVFIHKTFGEYLVANHIASWITEQDVELPFYIAGAYFMMKRFGIVRMFVNQYFQNANSNILLHLTETLDSDYLRAMWEHSISEGLLNIFNLLNHQIRKSNLYAEFMVNLGTNGYGIWKEALNCNHKSILSYLLNEYDSSEYLDEHSLCVLYCIVWKHIGLKNFRDEEIIILLMKVTKRMFLRMKPHLYNELLDKTKRTEIFSLQQICRPAIFQSSRVSVLEFVVGLIWEISIEAGSKKALNELSTWKDHFEFLEEFWTNIVNKIFDYCDSAENVVLFADWARENFVGDKAYCAIVRNAEIWKGCRLTLLGTIENIVNENVTNDSRKELLLDVNLWGDAFMQAPCLLKLFIEWSYTDLTISDVFYISLQIRSETWSHDELWRWVTHRCEKLIHIILAMKRWKDKHLKIRHGFVREYVKPRVVFSEAIEYFLNEDPWNKARHIIDSTTSQRIEQLWNQRKITTGKLSPIESASSMVPMYPIFSEDHFRDVFYEQIAWISQLNNIILMHPWKEMKITKEKLNYIGNKLLAVLGLWRSHRENTPTEKAVRMAYTSTNAGEIDKYTKHQNIIICDMLVKLWITISREITVMGRTFPENFNKLITLCENLFEIIQRNTDRPIVADGSIIFLLCHIQFYSMEGDLDGGCLNNFVDFANKVDALKDELSFIFMDKFLWKMLAETKDINLLLKAWRVGKNYATQECISRLLAAAVSAYDLLFWSSTILNNFKTFSQLPNLTGMVKEVWDDEDILLNVSRYERIMKQAIVESETIINSSLTINVNQTRSEFLENWVNGGECFNFMPLISLFENLSKEIWDTKMLASIIKSDIWHYCRHPENVIPAFINGAKKITLGTSAAWKILLSKQSFWLGWDYNLNQFLACARQAFSCSSTLELIRNPRAVEAVFQNSKILYKCMNKDKNIEVTSNDLKTILLNENLWVTVAENRSLDSLKYLIDMSNMFLDRRLILAILENANIWSAVLESADHTHLFMQWAVSNALTVHDYENIFNQQRIWTEMSKMPIGELFTIITEYLQKYMFLKPEALRYILETFWPFIRTQINRADSDFNGRHHLLETLLGSVRGQILENMSHKALNCNDFPVDYYHSSYFSSNEISIWGKVLYTPIPNLSNKLCCKLFLNEDIWKYCVKSNDISMLMQLWAQIKLHCFEFAKLPLLSLRLWFHAAEYFESFTLLISFCEEIELPVDYWRRVVTNEMLWTRVSSRGCPYTFECLWECAKKYTSNTTQLSIIRNENVWFSALPWPPLIQELLAVRENMKFDEDGEFLHKIWTKAAEDNYTESFFEIYESTKHQKLLQNKLLLPEVWLASITSVFQIRMILNWIEEHFGFDERLPPIMFSHDLWSMTSGNLSTVASFRVILEYGITNFNSSLSQDIADSVIWNTSVRSTTLFKLLVQCAKQNLSQTTWKHILLDERIWHYVCENGQVESLELLISCATSYTDLRTRKQIWSCLRFTTKNERSVEMVEKLTEWIRLSDVENDNTIKRILTVDVWLDCLKRGDILSFGKLCKCAETNLSPTDFKTILNNQDIWVTAVNSSDALSLLLFWSSKLKTKPYFKNIVNQHQFWINAINDCTSFDLIFDQLIAKDSRVLREYLIFNMDVWVEATRSYDIFKRLIEFCEDEELHANEWKQILLNSELWIQAVNEDRTQVLYLLCKKIRLYRSSCQSLLSNPAIWCKAVESVSLVNIIFDLLKKISKNKVMSITKYGKSPARSVLKAVILDKTFWTEASLKGRPAAIMVLWDEIRRTLGDKFCKKVICVNYIWESALASASITRLLFRLGIEVNLNFRKDFDPEIHNLLLMAGEKGFIESFIFLSELVEATDVSILLSKNIWSHLFSNTFHVIKMTEVINKNKIKEKDFEEFLAQEDVWVEFVQSGQYHSLRVLFVLLRRYANFKKLLLNPNIWRNSAHSSDVVTLLIEFGICIKLSAEEWSRVIFDEELWKVAARNCYVVTLDLLWNFGLTLNNRSRSENVLFNTEIWSTEKCPETLLMLHENLVAMFQFD